jgi:hypothetical protein
VGFLDDVDNAVSIQGRYLQLCNKINVRANLALLVEIREFHIFDNHTFAYLKISIAKIRMFFIG